jgi:hypothetical protein
MLLKGEGRWTNDALGFIVDMFPHVIEGWVYPEANGRGTAAAAADGPVRVKPRQGMYWYPTLALTVDMKKMLPVEAVEWVFVRVRAKRWECGRFDLDVEVWDEGCDLVAVGSHTGLVMGTESSRRKGVGHEVKL